MRAFRAMSLIVTSLTVFEAGHALPLVRGVPWEVARLALVHTQGARATSSCGCDHSHVIGGGNQLLKLESVKVPSEVANST